MQPMGAGAMGWRPFSDGWAAAVKKAINANGAFRREGKRWRWPVALILEAEPELGYEEDRILLLDLHRGRCRRAELRGDDAGADYVLAADYDTWKALSLGTTDPVRSLIRGRIKLRRGALPRLLLHAGAARALVKSAAAVDTSFPDEDRD